MLISAIQRNALYWEWADPPWELPTYVGDLTQALQGTKAWIAFSGVVEQVVVVAPPTLPRPLAPSVLGVSTLQYSTGSMESLEGFGRWLQLMHCA